MNKRAKRSDEKLKVFREVDSKSTIMRIDRKAYIKGMRMWVVMWMFVGECTMKREGSKK
jgi:hypothetical protein